MVADLLELAEHREHGAAAAEAVAVRLDPRHPAVDGRLVEARLLDREPAVLLLDRDRRQLELDLRRVLLAPEDERLHDRAQPLERPLVAAQLDRPRERPLEPLARAEQARVDDVHDRPELAEPVLDRRAGHRELPARGEPAQRLRALGRGVLDVLRLVEQHPVPGDPRERVGVAGGDVVGGDDDVAVRRDHRERLSRQPAHPVVEVDAQRRREPLDLGAPLADDAHRADDERRAERVVAPPLLALGDEHRDRLHRLAEPHVVGQDRADPEVAEQPQPAVAALLEGEEVELHRGGRRQRAEAPLAVPEQLRERPIERHLAELEPRLVGLEAGDGADELDDPGARAAALEEAQRSLDVGLAERVPAAGDPDERLLRGGELGKLLVRERDVADREPPVEARERRRREQPTRAVAASARGAQVDAQAARLAQPGGGEQDGDAALLEPRPRLAQERPDLGRLELDLGRLVAELDPRLRRGAARSRRAAGSGRAAGRSRAGTRRSRPRRSRRATRAARASGRPPPGATARARATTSRRLRAARRDGARAATAPPRVVRGRRRPSGRAAARAPRSRNAAAARARAPSAPRERARARRAAARAGLARRTPLARSRSRATWSTRTG